MKLMNAQCVMGWQPRIISNRTSVEYIKIILSPRQNLPMVEMLRFVYNRLLYAYRIISRIVAVRHGKSSDAQKPSYTERWKLSGLDSFKCESTGFFRRILMRTMIKISVLYFFNAGYGNLKRESWGEYFVPREMRMGSGVGSTMRNIIVCTVHLI